MRLPLELDTGPPRRRSVAGKPPRKKGGPGEGPTKTSNELKPPLRRIKQQGKQICFRLPTVARRAFYSVLVQELARALNLITAGIPLNSRRVAFKSVLRAMASIKRKQIRRRAPFQAHAHPYHAMISISVNTSKIDRSKLYESPKTGTKYLNLILLNQEDRFGNRMVIQPVGREAYAAGERGEQVGTWKEFGAKAKTPSLRKEVSRE